MKGGGEGVRRLGNLDFNSQTSIKMASLIVLVGVQDSTDFDSQCRT